MEEAALEREARAVVSDDHWLSQHFKGVYGPEYRIGSRFQEQLYVLIRKTRPLVVVEVGVEIGISTKFILAALVANGCEGRLISVDPLIFDKWYYPGTPPKDANEVAAILNFTAAEQQRWALHQKYNYEALPEIAVETEGWNMFLHDGDHEACAQTFDFSFGYKYLQPSGYILSDDFGWSTHKAWHKFAARNGVAWRTLGSCAIAQKPIDVPLDDCSSESVFAAYNDYVYYANQAAEVFGDPTTYPPICHG